jgi:trehalose 6-phosphate synthase/phosphatase
MRLVIVANRAPVTVTEVDGGYEYKESAGGLATGLRAYAENEKSGLEIVWVGWPGTVVHDEETVRAELLKRFNIHGVFLSTDEVDKFYGGFCNKTIWPLFHYFPSYARYDPTFWETYVKINDRFADTVANILKPDDIIWVQDYHLMLLPALLRKQAPDNSIGFFLHIPFPNYEVYRLLPTSWRREILEGLLGADLIGFHTHDYRTYFLRSVMRVLGLDDRMGEVLYNKRLIKVDTFPMSIDFDKYHSATKKDDVHKEKTQIQEHLRGVKSILSIDRQDYSKGILNRLEAYEYFLEQHPEWRQRVTMIMVVVPSRDDVERYQTTKKEIDEHVGRTNGTYGTLDWTPIHYQYRSLSFPELSALYNTCDVALITPLRDGMNLIAKEYVAARTDDTGVLILSEMAGAADELDQAILINPNNIGETAEAINRALAMPPEEQARRLKVMQARIQDYTVFRWAEDFLTTLNDIRYEQGELRTKLIDTHTRTKVVSEFSKSASRLIFLDYDGTLAPFVDNPTEAVPDVELKTTLTSIANTPNTRIILMSGRDRNTMTRWFSDVSVDMAAEHGLYLKKKHHLWRMIKPVRKSWKKKVRPIFDHYAKKLPGALVEEKEYSLVFHFRKSDPHFASVRVKELANHLASFMANMDLQLLYGNKVIEVRNAGIDKGVAAMDWLSNVMMRPVFVLAIGDDVTDEDLFRAMPKEAYTIKVGLQPSHAKYNLATQNDVLEFLQELAAHTRSLEPATKQL